MGGRGHAEDIAQPVQMFQGHGVEVVT